MFQYDQNTVCKLLATQELDFYQSLPEPLKTFTPEFRGKKIWFDDKFFIFFFYQGIVTVEYCEDELGFIKLIARPSTTSIESEPSSNEQEVSAINDAQSSDNVLRQSVQFVSRKKYLHFQIRLLLDYVVSKMDMLIIPIV